MKMLIILILFFCSIKTYSQDISKKIREIDSIVTSINASKLNVKRDTISRDMPSMGMLMKTYVTMVRDDLELKKYSQNVRGTITEAGKTKETISLNIFYFNHQSLIKVEEFFIADDIQASVHWYYSNDKPLYCTLQSEKTAERAEFLLNLGRSFLKLTP